MIRRAGIKIPELTPLDSPIDGSELVPASKSGSTYKFSTSQLAAYIGQTSTIQNLVVDAQYWADRSEQSANYTEQLRDQSQTSANNASLSESNALQSANNASLSESNALQSANNASLSESNALQSANNASLSESNALQSANNASLSESNALQSENKAQKWSEEDENVPVEPGQYSAKHWALKAQQSVTSLFVYRGDWDASTTIYPTPLGTGDWYRVSVEGAISGTVYKINDAILYNGSSWEKQDNTDMVTWTGSTNVTTLGNLPQLNFNITSAITPTDGQLTWNADYGTVDIGMNGGDVTQHVGFYSFFRVKASSSITKGQLVMATGTVGNSGVIQAAPATGLTEGVYAMGIAIEDISLNDFGDIVQFGLVRGINTTGSPVGEVWTDGTVLYNNPAVPGGLSSVLPTAPNAKVVVAIVVSASSNGSIFVRVSTGSTLGLTDSNVQFSTLGDNDFIVYNATNSRWENETPATARTSIGLGNVENTALSTWSGSTNITTLGTVTSGTWNGSTIAVANGGTGVSTLTGLVKGNGTSAFTAAVAGTDYAAPGTSSTWTVAQTYNNSTVRLKGSSTGYTTITSSNDSATNYTLYTPAANSYALISSYHHTISGPTAARTYTFPNANATVLTTNAAVTVAQGGTGATTLTGLVKGNGTSAFSAAVAGTDYLAPPSGTALLKANNGGALSEAIAGTDYLAPAAIGTTVQAYDAELAMLAERTTTTTGISKTIANQERVYVTTAGLTITLPASPQVGWEVVISVGNFTNTVVARNGVNIMGLAENMTIDKAYATANLLYVDATRGWILI